ncbi:MAG: DUF3078 domain-containing protein [Balneolales bacterium]|nr:DUF3078 domain-containing protein [Balneolales bacterium]
MKNKKLIMRVYLLTFLIVAFLTSTPVIAGGISWGEAPPDSVSAWSLEWRGAVNGNQASYRNWEQGGVSTLAIIGATNFRARYRRGDWGYNLALGLKYGQSKIEDDFRKTDDEINIRNTIRYFFEDDRWSLVGNVNLLTQFDEGLDRNQENVVSRFFAPAYLTETIGISYQPVEYFSIEAGASARQTFVRDTELSTRYGLDEGETFQNEIGYSFLVSFDRQIFENVRYVASIETFSNALRSPDRSDFTFNNELIGKINNYLNTTFRFTMLYNDDVSNKLQLRQTLSVGLSFNII